jgi:hypothetical protein
VPSRPRHVKRPTASQSSPSVSTRLVVRIESLPPKSSSFSIFKEYTNFNWLTWYLSSNPSSPSYSPSSLRPLFSPSPSFSLAGPWPRIWPTTCFALRTWRFCLSRRCYTSTALIGPCCAKYRAQVYPLTRYGGELWGPWWGHGWVLFQFHSIGKFEIF